MIMSDNNHMCWVKRLSLRDSVYKGKPPYVPMLVEDIPDYTASPDYEDDYVKTVQTIGEFNLGSTTLLSLTPGVNAEFPISLKKLPVEAVYSETSTNICTAVWAKSKVVKVFGELEKKETGTILNAHQLLPVEDIEGSCKTIYLLSQVTACRYSQYERVVSANEFLKVRWDRIKKLQRHSKDYENDS